MNDKGRMLIVDDEPIVRDSLGKWFAEEGYDVGVAESAAEALRRMADGRWDLALVDIKMPGVDGIELLHRLREVDPQLMIIIMTGYASVETAVAALKNGAYDYVTKPFDPDDIAHTVRNALAHRRAVEENVRLKETVAAAVVHPDLVGNSAPMKRVLEAIETVAPTEATVLITGESGTGKELVARAVHASSPRRFNPLVVIHCGALTESLLESELCGHEKGAFTGAQYRKKGNFEIAEGGTVFLDEIGDISLKTQTDLLRVLQEHEITRVGGTQPIHVNFRAIAATNKNLEEEIRKGNFREDLFFRLNVVQIKLPPLRERPDAIPLLLEKFIQVVNRNRSPSFRGFSPEAVAALSEYPWPGNVRQLRSTIRRAVLLADDLVTERHLNVGATSGSVMRRKIIANPAPHMTAASSSWPET